MTIEQHIKNVLQEQGKINVSGLGTFSIEPHEAKMLENEKDSFRLVPPLQLIRFEENQSNEATLAQRLAKSENKSIEQSQQEILAFSQSLRKNVSENEKVEMPDLGILSLRNTTLHFESSIQSPILADYYGLPSFEMPLVKRKLSMNRWAKYLSVFAVLLLVAGLVYWKIKPAQLPTATITSDTLKVYSPKDSITRKTVRYSIVVGSFASSTNAEQLKDKLTQDGYTPQIQEENNLYRVILNTFQSQAQANQELQLFLEKNKDLTVWVLLSR